MTEVHKCPVCGGVGNVPNGFYSRATLLTSSLETETCRTCDGTGIVETPYIKKY